MYGCLGFNNSRFFAKPIAALVTEKGRSILQSAVDVAQNKVGLEVIYGDTDSIMINTRLNQEKDLDKVLEYGEEVKREVNRLYRTLELEIDGIFRSMLLLKKKKYAAKTVKKLPNGEIVYGEELKGLDLVRRDWCIQSKDTGRYLTEQILSGQDSDSLCANIYKHLEELAKKMRNGELPLEKYIITKGLSKHPNDYPDGKSQPHVIVAKKMLENDRPVNTGDHIPYVITAPVSVSSVVDEPNSKTPSYAERARHPDEIERSAGALKPDVEWYLIQQILPPVSRLCEHIEEMSQQEIAEKLGLDGSKFSGSNSSARENYKDFDIDYTPESSLPDSERFKDVKKIKLCCISCGVETDFPGMFVLDAGGKTPRSGSFCTNIDCDNPYLWGHENHFEFYTYFVNKATMWLRALSRQYYEGVARCDEPCCNLETRQLSVAGRMCLRRGCTGQIQSMCTESYVNKHLLYFKRLFDEDHIGNQIQQKLTTTSSERSKEDFRKVLNKKEKLVFKQLHDFANRTLRTSAYNWISPSCWQGLFNTQVASNYRSVKVDQVQ